ncbi:MAG: magnesium transporter [Clostridia bacterium]|nr:magnesium transporter [Clostridia bacterium]
MDKDLLFQFMRTRFQEAGFTPDEIDLHITKYKEQYKDKTDDEMEADIMRRGGPSRMVARAIDKRNSVLMKDAEYRAFVEGLDISNETSAKPDSSGNTAASAAQPTETEPPSENTAVFSEEEDVKTYTPVQKTDMQVQNPTLEEDDPLRTWFSDASSAQSLREDEPIPDVFQKRIKPDSVKQTEKTDSVPLMSEVHTIPPLNDPPIPRPQNTPPHKTASQENRYSASMEADLNHTKIIHTASIEQQAVQHNPTAPRNGDMNGSQTETNAYHSDSSSPHMVRRERSPSKASTKPKKQLPAFLRLPEITYWGEGSEEGVRRFRILFAVSLPFVIILLLALTALLILLTVGITALIIGLVVSLVAEVAIGSIVSLVGIIYGISQLFLVLPIGMFELGLGIAAVGITMLVGILIYNLAVRFLPFLLRKLFHFAGFAKGYVQDLYYYVKGECYRR